MRLKPINNYILVKPLKTIREGLIHLPDKLLQKSNFAHILDVGKKVRDTFIIPNRIVMLSSGCIRTIFEDNWIIKEEDIIAVRYDIIRPIGNRILIKRFNEEKRSKGGIIIPSNHDSADQSLEGIFVAAGLVNGEKIEFPVPCGEKVKIEKWSRNIVEIDINGDYHLSVPVREIQYAFDT